MTLHPAGKVTRAVAALASLLALAALIAGLPAALYAVGGSPIPHTLPSWHQVIATLSRPDHGALLLAAIRWVSWLAWVAFTISVLVEVFARARGRIAPQLPVISPVQGFAAALIGTAILGLLPGIHVPRAMPPLPRLAQAVATAPPRPGQPVWAEPTAVADSLHVSTRWDRTATRPAVPHRELYRVVEGDNLWDIAARRLGGGERWQEIYTLNRGKPQPGGGSLTDPNLIYPGWVLVLPSSSSRPTTPARTQPQTRTGRPSAPHSTQHSHPSLGDHSPRQLRHRREARTPEPVHRSPSHSGQHERPVGIRLPGGGLVDITLAAAVSAALIAWRLHRRRVATARWPTPAGASEPPIPDVVARLRRAHLRSVEADAAESRGEAWQDDEQPTGAANNHAETADSDEGLDEFGAPVGRAAWLLETPSRDSTRRSSAHADEHDPATSSTDERGRPPLGLGRESLAQHTPTAPPAPPLLSGTVTFGMRDNAEIPLDEVARSGLGLTGAGAYGTARALLVCLLAAGGSGRRAPSVVIPEADINRLLSESLATGIVGNAAEPPNLMITDSLAEALSYLETEITDRSQPPEGSATGATPELAATVADERQEPGIALIAHPGQPAAGRLQALLETSERTGFIAILLGHWDSGITCNIGADGVVTAASRPGLPGIQTFHLPEHDAVPVLKFLRGAHGDVADDRPGNPFPLPYPAPRPQPAGPAASVHGDHVSRGKDTEPGPGGPPDRPSKPVGPLAAPDQVPGQPHPQAEARLSAPVVTATAPLVEVRLLGVPRIEAGDQEVVKGLRRTSRELIAFLSLFSDGVTGEKVAAALWPDHEPSSARTALQDALRSLRVALRTATGAHGLMFVTFQASRYRIDSTTVDVDLWRFRAAVVDAEQALRNDDAIAAREALTRAVECYQGPLAEDAAYEWIAPYREEIRRQAVDASTRLAWMYEPPESEQALALLDRTLAHDPFNEQLYQRIMTVQAHLGRADAVQRTLRLLEARLNELDTSPTRETYDLARDLQRPPQRA